MPIFEYKAVTKDGKDASGEINVASREEAMDYIERHRMLLIFVKEKQEKKKRMGGVLKLFEGGIPLLDRHIIFNNFSLMLNSGLSGFEALEVLKEDAKKKQIKKVMSNVQLALEQGRPISDGFVDFPKFFSPVVINLLKAGEVSGTLSDTTKLIATQYKKESNVRKKIKSAMIYPTILLTGSVLIVFGMLIFVVPRLAAIFEDSKVPLHPITKITLALSHGLSNILVDIGLVVFIASIFIFFSKTKPGRQIIFFFFSRMPMIKGVYRDLNLYRFCWTLGALIGSGVGILDAIEITSNVLTGTSYKNSGLRIKAMVSRGFTLGQALQEEKQLFSSLVSTMAVVGEKTGNFDKIFVQLGDFYEERFDSGLQVAISLLEPLLLVIMGLMIGTIAISVILPIYTLVSGVA